MDVLRCFVARDGEVELGCLGQIECVVGREAAGDVGATGEDASDLADAVGAVVEADADVVIPDGSDCLTVLVDDGEGRDELVGDAVVVELANAGEWIGVGAALGVAGDHGVEGLALFLPAEVAVHGVVAAGDGGDLSYADLANLLLEGFEVAEAAGGHGVAAVHEGVDVDAGEGMLGGELEERVEVALLRVHAAVGDESEEVEGAVALSRKLDGAGENGIGEEGAVLDGGIDTGDVHADDASGTEVEMADFAVAHLAVGKSDVVVAGADEGVGVGGQELVVGGLAGERDSVAVSLRAVAPAVEDGEDNRFLRHCFGSGYQEFLG